MTSRKKKAVEEATNGGASSTSPDAQPSLRQQRRAGVEPRDRRKRFN